MLSRIKVKKTPDFREVLYDSKHWDLLARLRSKAILLMKPLAERGLSPWIHGSIARGDIWDKSDIDIVIPMKIPGYVIDIILDQLGIKPYARYLVAATPTTTLKAVISLDEEELTTITIPIAEFRQRDYEFYKFSGLLTYEEISLNKRVPGVNKNLVLIIPTESGHLEAPVIGYEDYTAKVLGVSVDIVRERVEVLTKRDSVGRTGIFAKLVLAPNESFEEALERLFRERPLLRRIYEGLV